MVPKVAKGGDSFIGAGGYYLGEGRRSSVDRDAQLESAVGGVAGYVLGEGRDPASEGDQTHAGRVGFTLTRNLPTEDSRLAFMLMQGRYQAYRAERAGKRGRPLSEPVYSYSLSWAPGETPDREEMEFAAETTLVVLGMEAHQAVIVEHRDKAYAHIHVVVNRVHPTETRAVHTSMDQYKLSRWAEAFELERGQIWCERRVENNAQRDMGASVKDTVSQSRSEVEAERSGAAAEIAAWRAEQDALRREEHRDGAKALWVKQQAERLALEARTRKSITAGRQAISERYKPAWRALYKAERDHVRHIKLHRRGILERAVHAFVHARPLALGKERLSLAEIAIFALSERALLDRIAAVTQVRRSALSERQLGEVGLASKAAWSRHHNDLKPMKERHKIERDALAREAKKDWTLLRNIRDVGLDEALFKAGKVADVKPETAPKPVVAAFSIKRLTEVWQVFRDRLSGLDQNQTVGASAAAAVPDRTVLRKTSAETSGSNMQNQVGQVDYENEI